MITRTNCDNISPSFEEGELILIDKNVHKTSFNVIYKIRKAVGVKKVGHAGTLDPMASGLLIVCTGKMTKEISKFQNLEKTYKGIFEIGASTSSMDSETAIIERREYKHIGSEEIFKVRQKFIGEILQKPPMYSAVKYKGKALYKYARKGKHVERDARKVYVDEFIIDRIDLPDVYFTIRCSKGTYIRVVANDFGEELGCGAFLKELRRISIGDYKVEDALKVDEFTEMFQPTFS